MREENARREENAWREENARRAEKENNELFVDARLIAVW